MGPIYQLEDRTRSQKGTFRIHVRSFSFLTLEKKEKWICFFRFTSQSGSGANSGKRLYDDEDVKIRSIIKEEDLNQMASIGNDIGWAGHEDIDYKYLNLSYQ